MLVLGKKVLICASHGTVAAGEIADTVLALASLLPNALSVGSRRRGGRGRRGGGGERGGGRTDLAPIQRGS